MNAAERCRLRNDEGVGRKRLRHTQCAGLYFTDMSCSRRATRPPAGRPLASRRIGSSQRSARRLGRRIEREVGPRRILRRLGESTLACRRSIANESAIGRVEVDASEYTPLGRSETMRSCDSSRWHQFHQGYGGSDTARMASPWMVRRCGDGVIAVLGGAAMHIHHRYAVISRGRRRWPRTRPEARLGARPGRPLGPARRCGAGA